MVDAKEGLIGIIPVHALGVISTHTVASDHSIPIVTQDPSVDSNKTNEKIM